MTLARMDKLAIGEDGEEEGDEDYIPEEGEVDLNDLDHPTRRKGTHHFLKQRIGFRTSSK